MKRINLPSLFLGAVFALALVSACNAWQSRGHDKAIQPQNSVESKWAQSNDLPSYESKKSVNGETGNVILWGKLPSEAQRVIQTIKTRGMFPYAKDGSVFGNREGLLPRQPRGYYQEYTVVTPNANNRGARRIVAGKGNTGDVATAGEFYYTADHYRTFYRVKE